MLGLYKTSRGYVTSHLDVCGKGRVAHASRFIASPLPHFSPSRIADFAFGGSLLSGC